MVSMCHIFIKSYFYTKFFLEKFNTGIDKGKN